MFGRGEAPGKPAATVEEAAEPRSPLTPGTELKVRDRGKKGLADDANTPRRSSS